MIFLMIIWAFTMLLVAAFSILPSAETFALPDGVITAISTVVGWTHWVLHLAGDEIANAAISAILFYVGFGTLVLTLEIVRNFRVPIISKWLR